LVAVLTCIPSDAGQERTIKEIHRLLRPGGPGKLLRGGRNRLFRMGIKIYAIEYLAAQIARMDLFTAAFLILFSASTRAGLVASDFLFGLGRFGPVQQ
jgi:hypothetical protein